MSVQFGVSSAAGGPAKPASKGGAPTPAAKPNRPRLGGRFARWHTDPDPPAEEEGWLLTYLDMITLMLVMMVVMLAFTKPAQQNPETPSPTKESRATPILPVTRPNIVPPLPLPVPPVASSDTSQTPKAEQEKDPLEGLPLDRLDKNIEVVVNQGSVSFRISSEILFASGEANLSAAGLSVLARLVPVLNGAAQHRIVVEGHTDNVPIQTERFPSNWELSTGRAASVVRYLQSQGIAPARMRATGYADTRPLASNDTPQGQAQNRHVEVILEAPK